MLKDQVHEIWRRELALDEFSDDDDFFALGGHSLIMGRIQLALQDELGVEVPMDVLMRASTVNKSVEVLDRRPAVTP